MGAGIKPYSASVYGSLTPSLGAGTGSRPANVTSTAMAVAHPGQKFSRMTTVSDSALVAPGSQESLVRRDR